MESNGRIAITESLKERSVGELIRDSATQAQAVLRGEVRVALAEASEDMRRAGRSALLVMFGGALAILTVTLLLIAAIAALAVHVPLWVAVLIGAASSLLLTVSTFVLAARVAKEEED